MDESAAAPGAANVNDVDVDGVRRADASSSCLNHAANCAKAEPRRAANVNSP